MNMILFLMAAGAVAYYLSPLSPQPSDLLIKSFEANPALNALILSVLAIGIFYNFDQAGVVQPSIQWIESFRESVDPRRARLPRPPGLIYAVAKLLLDADERGGKLAPESTRAILDSVQTRMDESREMGRYIANLLVFLGLLGTFWGLLQTVNGVTATISGLAVGGDTEDAVAQLIKNLTAPLSGMGTAFSSSLFGLSGSLVCGFLELQASAAQGRFYTDLEDWLSGMTETRVSSRDGARLALESGEFDGRDIADALRSLEAAIAANTEIEIKAAAANAAELKDEIRALNRSLIRGRGE
jgi:hypothetical protein